MKVSELIDKLKSYEPNCDVIIIGPMYENLKIDKILQISNCVTIFPQYKEIDGGFI